MKSFVKKLILFVFAGAFGTSAFADPNDIQLGLPGYGGTGCPGGSVSATLSPDRKELSLLFDSFVVEAGGGPRARRIARKGCNIAVPVHVPQGLSISIIQVDYRGFVSVPPGGMARFSTEYFFAGTRGPRFRRTFRGGFDNDYFLNNPIGIAALSWSRCGDDVNLRVNASMLVRSNRNKDDALATVDSADFHAGIIYKIQWRRC
ncbi:MAG: DUF4360 domain-containing protein [Bacteriovoracaceae bacterium]|jgi:hypothetical protein|nr:DUF4360 domain-containing protein [Bacteriovoracaceae bacterium]